MRVDLRVLPTAELGPSGLRGVRSLLESAFAELGGYRPGAWDHALGGVHVLAGPPQQPFAHAAVVLRRLYNGGVAWRTGYVESVAVHPDHRRTGLGGVLMAEVERLVRGGHQLGALGASPPGRRLYRRRGWRPWPGELAAFTPDGVVGTPERAGEVHVFPVTARLDPDHPLICDWRGDEPW